MNGPSTEPAVIPALWRGCQRIDKTRKWYQNVDMHCVEPKACDDVDKARLLVGTMVRTGFGLALPIGRVVEGPSGLPRFYLDGAADAFYGDELERA